MQANALNQKEQSVADELVRVLDPLNADQRKYLIDKSFKNVEEAIAEKHRLSGKIASYEKLASWFDGIIATKVVALEKNDCSRLHRLKEAVKDRRILTGDGKLEEVEAADALLPLTHTFVVRHDWAGAFDGAEGIEDGIRLPYEYCCFEFRFSGMSIMAVCVDDGSGLRFTLIAECGDYWYIYGTNTDDGKSDIVIQMVWKQIRAICIALDAEVATHEVIRAPEALNQKRTKAGKTPLHDYHIVDLSRRHRIANPAASGETEHGKVRMHFRRGHWRHYEAHRTWIKWQLVGNPDLGFIQKGYSL